jgi:large subunit ribosomal protein L19
MAEEIVYAALAPKDLKAGMTVRVHEKIKDLNAKGEERERVQIFEGLVKWVHGSGISRTMTVRKMSGVWAVEKVYPIHSPVVAKLELVKQAHVRRAKLSFLTNKRSGFKRTLREKKA